MSISARLDPQIKPLYRWETTNGWDRSNISFKKAKILILASCQLYKIQPPEILLHATRSLPWSCPSLNAISLQRDRYLNVPITLHEATHHIVYNLYGARPQDHGPTFLGIYLNLLNRNGFAMYTSAETNGLHWNNY